MYPTLAVLLAYLLHNAAGVALKLPRSSGPTATMGSLADPAAGTCVSFYHPFCGPKHNHAMFPNPRQEGLSWDADEYKKDAFEEISDFALLLDTRCSEKLATLLCYLYFPFCHPEVAGLAVRPCLSLCEEVTRDCADALTAVFAERGHLNFGWQDLQQFNCSHYTYKGQKVYQENGVCANFSQDSPSTSPKPVTPKAITDDDDDLTPTEETEETSTTVQLQTPIPTEASCSLCAAPGILYSLLLRTMVYYLFLQLAKSKIKI